MDSIQKLPLTLNTKCDILLGMFKEHMKTQEKHMPMMLRSVYMPMINTIRMFLNITPEWTLKDYLNRVHMVYEACQCNYQEEKDFKEHLSELFTTWQS